MVYELEIVKVEHCLFITTFDAGLFMNVNL